MEDIIHQLYKSQCIRFGSFKLKSGQVCPYYVNLRLLSRHPQLFRSVVDSLSEKIVKENTIIAGVPEGATLIAGAIAYKTFLPCLHLNKQVKSHGEQLKIDEYKDTNSLVLIEDVITSGASILEVIEKMPENSVKQIVIIVDRQQGGLQNLKTKYPSIKVDCLLKLEDMIDSLSNLMLKEEKDIMVEWLTNNKSS